MFTKWKSVWDEALARKQEMAAWLSRTPLWKLCLGFSYSLSDEEDGVSQAVFCKGEWEARRVWFMARILCPVWGLSTDCILLHSFGHKHPLNVYCAKSDRIFSCLCAIWIAPIFLEIPGSSIFLSFHFGNTVWKILFFCCHSDATWHHELSPLIIVQWKLLLYLNSKLSSCNSWIF